MKYIGCWWKTSLTLLLAPTAKQDCTLRNAVPSRKGLGPFSVTEAPKSCLITAGYQDSVVRTPGFSQESPHTGQTFQPSTSLNEVSISQGEKKKSIYLALAVLGGKMKFDPNELKRLTNQKGNEHFFFFFFHFKYLVVLSTFLISANKQNYESIAF